MVSFGTESFWNGRKTIFRPRLDVPEFTHMTKNDSLEQRIASRYLRQMTADEATEGAALPVEDDVPVARMLDLANLAVAYSAFTNWLASKGTDSALSTKGSSLVRRFNRELQKAIEQHIVPLLDQPSASSLRQPLMMATRPGSPEQTTQNMAGLFIMFMPWARTRPQFFNALFSGTRAMRAARELAAVCEEESPEGRLNKCASIAPISGLSASRKWIEQVAAEVGAPLSPAESVLTDAETAQSLGETLQGVQASIDSVQPNTPEAADLHTRRTRLIEQINQVAATSSAPDAVMAAAAGAAMTPARSSIAQRFNLTDEQEEVMRAEGKLCVAAAAGSGKTATLVATIANLVETKGIPPGRILGCSFTRAASAELEARTQKAGIQGSNLGTTHSVAREIIRRHRPNMTAAVRATKNADKAFKIAMKQVEMDVAGFAAQVDSNKAIIQRLESIPGWRGIDILRSFHEQLSRGRTLSDKQLAVIPKFERGGGGGRRWAGEESNDIIDLLWDKLAKTDETELQEHWEKLAADFGDQNEAPVTKGVSKYWSVPIGEWFNVGKKPVDEQGKPMGAKRALLMVDNWKNANITVEMAKTQFGEKDPIVALYGAYEWLKKNDTVLSPCMDYTDQLIVARDILQNDPRALAMEQSRYDAVFVDEAQDLNQCQFDLFQMLGQKAKVMAFIGDDKQSIYAFRGAKPENFVALAKTNGFKTMLMTTNFRSGSAIVEAANKLIARNEDRQIPMVCKSHEPRGVGQIRAVTPKSHEAGASAIAQEIKDAVEAGESPSDFGILVRNNAEADAYTLSLIARGIPYRMLKREQGGYFGKPVVKALSSWLRLIVGGSDTEINEAFVEAHRTPGFGLDEGFATNLARTVRGSNYYDYCAAGGPVYTGPVAWLNKKVQEYVSAIQNVRATSKGDSASLVRVILDLKGPKGSFIEALIKLVDEDDVIEDEGADAGEDAVKQAALAPVRPLMLMAENFPDPANMLRFIAKMKDANQKIQKNDPTKPEDWKEPAVLVGTVHGWKGLQAKHVYAVMAGGVFPHFKTDQAAREGDEKAHDEERRLAYVAITRGEDTVTVVSPQSNYHGKAAALSRFVMESCIPVEGATSSETVTPGAPPITEVNDEFDRAVNEAEAEAAWGKQAAKEEEPGNWLVSSLYADEDEPSIFDMGF